MTYNISLSPEQIDALAAWVQRGPDMAPVKLRVGTARGGVNYVLLAAQGDDQACFDIAGNLRPDQPTLMRDSEAHSPYCDCVQCTEPDA